MLVYIFFFFFFFFFFDLGFTTLSRIFCLYCTNCSSKVAENRRIQGKTTSSSISRAWLSNVWLEWGSNHSTEKPKLVYLHIVYLHRFFPSVTDSWLMSFVILIVAVLFLICCFKWPPPPLTAIHFHLNSPLFCCCFLICHFCHLPFFFPHFWHLPPIHFQFLRNVFTGFVF